MHKLKFIPSYQYANFRFACSLMYIQTWRPTKVSCVTMHTMSILSSFSPLICCTNPCPTSRRSCFPRIFPCGQSTIYTMSMNGRDKVSDTRITHYFPGIFHRRQSMTGMNGPDKVSNTFLYVRWPPSKKTGIFLCTCQLVQDVQCMLISNTFCNAELKNTLSKKLQTW